MSNKESKIRTLLAQKRTLLAGSRTLLSHIRTALVFLSVAFGYIELNKKDPINWFTIIMFIFAGIFLVLGIFDFVSTKIYVNTFDDVDSDIDE